MSAATFVTTGEGRTAIRFTQGNLFIPLPAAIAASWDTIRIGVLISANQVDAALPYMSSWPRFFVGLSSGQSGYHDDDTTHCVGFMIGHSIAKLWSIAGPPYCYQPYTTTVKKIGTTETLGGGSYQNLLSLHIQGSLGPSAETWTTVLIEIDKGSPNYTVATRMRQNAGTTSDNRFGIDVVAPMCAEGKQVAEFTVQQPSWGTTNGTLAVDEAGDGTLDHLHISWDRLMFPIYIDGIAVRKIS